MIKKIIIGVAIGIAVIFGSGIIILFSTLDDQSMCLVQGGNWIDVCDRTRCNPPAVCAPCSPSFCKFTTT